MGWLQGINGERIQMESGIILWIRVSVDRPMGRSRPKYGMVGGRRMAKGGKLSRFETSSPEGKLSLSRPNVRERKSALPKERPWMYCFNVCGMTSGENMAFILCI